MSSAPDCWSRKSSSSAGTELLSAGAGSRSEEHPVDIAIAIVGCPRRRANAIIYDIRDQIIKACHMALVIGVVLPWFLLPAKASQLPATGSAFDGSSTSAVSSANSNNGWGGGSEYCHFETFRARCPPGEVILMKSAYYGRRNLGRCVRTNFGFVGCYADVVRLMDRRCTGRTSCDVDVIEPNFDDIRPCNVELKSYLHADHTCIAVASGTPPTTSHEPVIGTGSASTALSNNCQVTLSHQRPTALPRPKADIVHHLGINDDESMTSLQTAACGDESSPWLIKVSPGQRINITLYEFGTITSLSSTASFSNDVETLKSSSVAGRASGSSGTVLPNRRGAAGSGNGADFLFSSKPVMPYGRLREPNSRETIDIVAGEVFGSSSTVTRGGSGSRGLADAAATETEGHHHMQREWHVMTTETSTVEVVIYDVQPGREDFLLTFTVVGCPDLQTGPDFEIRYSADRSIASVTCRGASGSVTSDLSGGGVQQQQQPAKTTAGSWRLACSDRGWHGYIGNCSSVAAAAASASVASTSTGGTSSSGNPSAAKPHTSATASYYTHLKASTALVATIVVGVSVVISLCVLVIGLIIIKRMRCYRGASGSSSHVAGDLLSRFDKSSADYQLRPLYHTSSSSSGKGNHQYSGPGSSCSSSIGSGHHHHHFSERCHYHMHQQQQQQLLQQQQQHSYPDCPYSLLQRQEIDAKTSSLHRHRRQSPTSMAGSAVLGRTNGGSLRRCRQQQGVASAITEYGQPCSCCCRRTTAGVTGTGCDVITASTTLPRIKHHTVSSGGSDELVDDDRSPISALDAAPTQLPEEKLDLLPEMIDVATGSGGAEKAQLIELSKSRNVMSSSLANFDAIAASLGIMGDKTPAESSVSAKLVPVTGPGTMSLASNSAGKSLQSTDMLGPGTSSCIKCNLELIGNVVVVGPTTTASSVTAASCNVLSAFD